MEEFKGDKRSKSYKEWKKNHANKSEGVGDTVAKITKATGIEKAAKFLAGEDCGCDKRKEVLNHIFPYQKPLCLTEEEYNYLDTKMGKLSTVTIEEQKLSLIHI
jgi:ABC-type thiamine transport system ATPase subunit